MATTKCTSKRDKGCLTFKIKKIEYDVQTCKLTTSQAKIEIYIEGGKPFNIEQYMLKMEAGTHPQDIEFASEPIISFTPGKTEVQGNIDPSVDTVINIYTRQVGGATPPSTAKFTIQCRFWHGDALALAQPNPCNRAAIILTL